MKKTRRTKIEEKVYPYQFIVVVSNPINNQTREIETDDGWYGTTVVVSIVRTFSYTFLE
jgi:hypothetical protein